MRLVAIHQPTFLPWLGWFDKLVRADALVLLDAVQFPKKGGTWLNRVRILAQGRPVWMTMPVDRTYHGFRPVREVEIDDSRPWRERAAKTIRSSYARAPYFGDVYPVVEELLNFPTRLVADFNEAAIRRIGQGLGLDLTKLVYQSRLGVQEHGTDLLVELCKAAGGGGYLTGDGAGDYLVPERFSAAGLELVEQRFAPPRYPQLGGDFFPGLSVVDALMNCGWAGTAELLRRTTVT
jgi:hypothetical protein